MKSYPVSRRLKVLPLALAAGLSWGINLLCLRLWRESQQAAAQLYSLPNSVPDAIDTLFNLYAQLHPNLASYSLMFLGAFAHAFFVILLLGIFYNAFTKKSFFVRTIGGSAHE